MVRSTCATRCEALPDTRGGYPGHVVGSHLVDFYAKVPDPGARWVSPVLPEGPWTLRVTPTGEVPTWSQKDGTRFGSTGSRVAVAEVLVLA